MGRINRLTLLDDNASIGESYNDMEGVVKQDKEVKSPGGVNMEIARSLSLPVSLTSRGNSNGK